MKAETTTTFEKDLKEFRVIKFFPDIDIQKIKTLKENSTDSVTEQDLVYSILHEHSYYNL